MHLWLHSKTEQKESVCKSCVGPGEADVILQPSRKEMTQSAPYFHITYAQTTLERHCSDHCVLVSHETADLHASESFLIFCPKLSHMQISLYFLPWYEVNAERFTIVFLYTILHNFSYIRLVSCTSPFSQLFLSDHVI